MQTANKTKQPWWCGAVIYQVYPRSFLDTTGDGIGDLKGIIQKLDYVAALEVDGIWLSPFFKSPMCDFGYDVSDYCDVDPIFGTLDDFDQLIEKAHGLGLKVIIDQVYSHTSDQHAWFLESQSDKTNPKADWYVWADPKPDGAPPNNWQSVFGGGAWEWDSRRRQYYLHNFLTSQPDLNLHNADVQRALLDVARFWLDRGVNGFRLDAINFAMHDPDLRDNPAAKNKHRTLTRPYDYQDHIYNMSHPNIPNFLEKLRKLTDQYGDIYTVAEIVGSNPLSEMKSFTAENKRLNAAYNFDFLYADALTPKIVRSSISNWGGGTDERQPAWAFSNHDAPRAISRWSPDETDPQYAKLYMTLLMCLYGGVFLYQGEELGLPQAEVKFEDLKDPEAIANWPRTLGRDGARTPMPWLSTTPHAGFSSIKPWLPLDPRHITLAVERQESDPSAMLNFTRALISLRAQTPALRNGKIEFLQLPESGLGFTRRHEKQTCACVFNLGTTPISWRPNDHDEYKVITSVGMTAETTPPELLSPGEGYVAEKTG